MKITGPVTVYRVSMGMVIYLCVLMGTLSVCYSSCELKVMHVIALNLNWKGK